MQHPKIDVNLKTKDSTLALTYALRNDGENAEELWNAFLAAGANVNCKGTADCVSLNQPTHYKKKNVTDFFLDTIA